MADIVLFDYNLFLDAQADVSIDFNAGQSYSAGNGNYPWGLTLMVDGVQNNSRGGSGTRLDVISVMGAAGNLAPGNHNVKIVWFGDGVITLQGAVLRILCTKK